MVLEVDEFTQEFAYLSSRDRWLAREAIGYGTLRGLALSWQKDTTNKPLPSVLVTSGVGLTPSGQLVCVTSNQCADINQWLEARDTEISNKFAAGATNEDLTLYVTLAYCDCKTDDAPVPGEPCRSADELMQPSRVTDSFQLELSYEPPLQEEEYAVRGFSAWLRKITIVSPSVNLDTFVAEVRAWHKSTSDPASLTISETDVPKYFATAFRLWATELRVAAAALQRFKLWLYNAPYSNEGATNETDFRAVVSLWTPDTSSWPGNLTVNTSDRKTFIEHALPLWDSEIVPKWYSEFCGCGAPVCADSIEDRLLLGALKFKIIKTAGNTWMVDFTSALTTSVDESFRPVLLHLRALQERLIPTPEIGSILPYSVAPHSLAPLNIPSAGHVAMGRLTPGKAQTTPTFGNLKINVDSVGEVSFTFDGYQIPDGTHDYIVQVIASFIGNKSEPAVRFFEFNNTGFVYKVTRSNKGLTVAELKTIEFQVTVSIIEQPN